MIKKNKKYMLMPGIILLLIVTMVGCTSKNPSIEKETEVVEELISLEETGILPSNDMDPDYDIVFNQSEVMEIHIDIEPTDWEAMQDDLDENIGSGNRRTPTVSTEESFEPIWVQSSITVDGITWDHVGIRFKGNSSLTSTYGSGNSKFSFKLDFDEFEEDYPEIENQRFYGFKQLNLNNNYMDASLMREKVAADLFQEFDVPVAATSFCVIYIDYGEGSQYYGVYTMVEEMDDTGILEQFAEDEGNLYKPDGDAASFSIGTYDKEEFEKKNNEEEADYSDVEALYEIINSNLRITDSNSWKTTLENVFNVDGFMKYLAVNNVIQNWDTYGNMTHNYYLYQDLETGQLNWIPWDNNEAFLSGKGNRSAMSLDMEEVSDHWPLIRYLLEEPEYKVLYEAYLQEFVEEVFTMENMVEIYDTYYALIKEYAYAEEDGYTFLSSEKAFDQEVSILKTHAEKRIEAVKSYLEK